MISILMATYNGEHFLKEQLDSLLNQSLLPTKIYICDDHSTDTTWAIIQKYKRDYPDLVVASQRPENSGGAKYNFLGLMIDVKDDYVMLCDQDDVWLPDKIKSTFDTMKRAEEEWGQNTPILVHTDLVVVNEKLQEIASSAKEMIGTAQVDSLKEMMLQNNFTGCTGLYNRALADLVEEVPEHFIMHDWWLATIAVTFGKMVYLNRRTSLYRQHGGNEIGVQKVGTLRHKIYKITHTNEIKQALFDSYRQAGSFLDMYKSKLSDKEVKLLKTYSSLPTKGRLQKIMIMKREGFFRKGFLRMLSQLIFG